jgi:hypothetical protein
VTDRERALDAIATVIEAYGAGAVTSEQAAERAVDALAGLDDLMLGTERTGLAGCMYYIKVTRATASCTR